MLRLGGKKFHGLGAVNVELVEARRNHPAAPRLGREDATAFADDLVEKALRKPQRRRTWETLHRVIGAE